MRIDLRRFFNHWKQALRTENDYTAELAEILQEMLRDNHTRFSRFNEITTNPKFYLRINKSYQDPNTGDSFIHMAVRIRRRVIVDPLFSIGCPPDLSNHQGKKPADLTSFFQDVVRIDPAERKRDEFMQEYAEDCRDAMHGDPNKVFPGRRVSNNLNLFFTTKKHGICVIPDRWIAMDQKDDAALTLHQRLAIAEAIASSRATSINQMNPDKTSNCYSVANLGFIVSTDIHIHKGPQHGTQFITIPINDPEFLVYAKTDTDYHHSEETLYHYLNQPEHIRAIVGRLRDEYNLMPGYKVYGVVLDIHSTYTMCKLCENATYELMAQREKKASFLEKLETILLTEFGYILPKEQEDFDILSPLSRRLHFTTRVSCGGEFPLGRPQDRLKYQYPLYNLDSTSEEKESEESPNTRNIKAFNNSVIIHSRTDEEKNGNTGEITQHSKTHNFRYPISFQPISKIFVQQQTAFVMRNTKVSSERFNYMKSTKRDSRISQFWRIETGNTSYCDNEGAPLQQPQFIN